MSCISRVQWGKGISAWSDKDPMDQTGSFSTVLYSRRLLEGESNPQEMEVASENHVVESSYCRWETYGSWRIPQNALVERNSIWLIPWKGTDAKLCKSVNQIRPFFPLLSFLPGFNPGKISNTCAVEAIDEGRTSKNRKTSSPFPSPHC